MRPPARPRVPQRRPETPPTPPTPRPAEIPPTTVVAKIEPPRADVVPTAATPAPAPVPTLMERLSQRTRARRRLTWHRWLRGGIVAVILAVAGWLVFVSPLLALRDTHIEISGTGRGTTVATEAVHEAISGFVGTPLARLDLAEVTAAVTELTQVRSAETHRAWPNGLRVVVTPRVPVAVMASESGYGLLDVDGVEVGSLREPPDDLPLVDISRTGQAAAPILAAVLEVLAALPPDLRDDVALAGGEAPGAIELQLTDGATVRWGDAQQAELKAAVLTVLRGEEARIYDVTVPQTPTAID